MIFKQAGNSGHCLIAVTVWHPDTVKGFVLKLKNHPFTSSVTLLFQAKFFVVSYSAQSCRRGA